MKTILIVEDSEDDLFFLKRALRAARVENPVQIVRDGQQALDYMEGVGEYGKREEHHLPALILLDLKLPYLMGLDVLKWIRDREVFDPIVVVVLTSSKEESDVGLAHRLGCNSFLVKPATSEKLLELVRMIGEEPAPEVQAE